MQTIDLPLSNKGWRKYNATFAKTPFPDFLNKIRRNLETAASLS